MTANDFITHWKMTAEEDIKTAEDLFHLKRYSYCLFFTHLAIEKLLKGLVYKNTKTHAPPIHDLVKLLRIANLQPQSGLEDQLREITSWNIKTRYDDYKREFYKKATKEFAQMWLSKTKEIIQWLKNQY